MPNMMDYSNENDWMGACVPKVMDENGGDKEAAVGKCMGMWAHKAEFYGMTMDEAIKHFAAKYGEPTYSVQSPMVSIKAITDGEEWVLDVNAAPFTGKDSDGQWFEPSTNYMLDDFSAPAILYHHGVMPGQKGLQKNPIVIGKATNVEVKSDGVHVRVVLNKALEWARRVWEAAKKGLAVASSDSIAHLARLETNGKTIMYEKNRPGRISVWPLAGLSLWDKTEGNFQPASRYALALPAMKAIYRDAGIPFPATLSSTDGALSEAFIAAKRARREEILAKAKSYLAQLGEE